MRNRPHILPAGLSIKQKRRLSGQRGAAKSHWRFGFGGPISPADKGWADRMETAKEKK